MWRHDVFGQEYRQGTTLEGSQRSGIFVSSTDGPEKFLEFYMERLIWNEYL